MFRLLKKKKNEPNRAFGTVKKFDGYWSTSEKAEFVLWNKAYQVNCMVSAGSNQAEITKKQEDVYIRFKENCGLLQREIERVVAAYFSTTDASVLLSKFTPYQMRISPSGECAIIASNADDENQEDALPGLAVVLYPRVAIFTKEDYLEYALRDGCDEIREILYGGS